MRKVKNFNAPQNKINSAMFWQKSYRLEWYLIIWHYLNLYVYSISFITKHILLWKLTGAKFNCESMFQQERNQYQHFMKFVWIFQHENCSEMFSFAVRHNASVYDVTGKDAWNWCRMCDMVCFITENLCKDFM